jgi:excisionase family DNA binding protein
MSMSANPRDPRLGGVAVPYEWDELWSAQEVAARLRVHVFTFQRWCRAGKGPTATQIGDTMRYAESDVQRWIQSRRVEREECA